MLHAATLDNKTKQIVKELEKDLYSIETLNTECTLHGALSVSKATFNRHRLRVKNVEGPQSMYYFMADNEYEKNVSWIVGLSQAYILYGFKSPTDVDVLLRVRESISPLADVLYVFGIEGLYNHINKASIDDIYNWLCPILSETKSDYRNGFINCSNPDYWLHRLVESYDLYGYPLDANLFNVYLLNLSTLSFGQSLKIKSNHIFMPIKGSYLEVIDFQQSLCEFDVVDWLYSREYETDKLSFRQL
ncbi:hypothetical protein [Photobacterium lutimaris]|uniref:Uncharacterized protein n=1 Tax=Photobacterium lutimaris TaxID=388278 RepID=A0A2T3J2T0_9GAMM|nr:hypothetical protein [Photobacterium lutimaris]PSU35598.1 hypothetical protein C9I99_00830 [Photobacterium lutimaris]TDR78651.1 hypothetical protein DFP78_101163 [Photobacterium lutimaris]